MTMRSNVIRLRSVYGKVIEKYFIQPAPNPKTRAFAPHVKNVNSKGDMELSETEKEELARGEKYFIRIDDVFEIQSGREFDLDDLVDKSIWEAIKHCPLIAESRGQRDDDGNLVIDGGKTRYGRAELYVEREGEVSKAKVSRAQIINKAQNYIFADTMADKIRKCKVLGRDLEHANPADVDDYMIEISQKDPKKIITLYEDESWKMQLFLLTAVERGVIKKQGGIYTYGDDMRLGVSLESTVELLKDIKYRTLYNTIKAETYPEYSTQEEIDDMKVDLKKDIQGLDKDDEASKTKSKTQIKK